MGYALTPVRFWDSKIEIGTVVSASKPEFFRYSECDMPLWRCGPGRLEAYDDVSGHYKYTFVDGQWFEFYEAT